jgi:hypothetical protein
MNLDGLDECSGANNVFVRCLAQGIARGEDAMPFKVIFLKGNNEVDTRRCETKTEAVAYAEARRSFQPETVSAIIVDDDSNEIVFTTGQAKEPAALRP